MINKKVFHFLSLFNWGKVLHKISKIKYFHQGFSGFASVADNHPPIIKIILYLCERESDAYPIKRIEPMEDKSLLGGCYVIRMHDDFEIIDEVETGFNDNFELVIRLTRSYSEFEQRKFKDPVCWMEAFIPRDEAYDISKKLGVSLIDLPEKLAVLADKHDLHEINVNPQDCLEVFYQQKALLEKYGAHPDDRYKPAKYLNGTLHLPWH